VVGVVDAVGDTVAAVVVDGEFSSMIK
jgi:hypothetical protein